MSRLRGALALAIVLAVAAPASAQKFKLPKPSAAAPKPAETPKTEPAAPSPDPAPAQAVPAVPAPPPKPFPAPQVKLPRDMAFREGTSEVFGQKIAWFEIGQGPAVVLLHGLAGDRRDWVHVMRKLSADHRVIAFDAPGFGESAKPGISYSIDTIADFLDGFLAAQKIDRATIVGHSTGAWAAAILTTRHPERIVRFVALAPIGIGAAVDPIHAEIFLPSSRVDVLTLLSALYVKDRATADERAIDLMYERILARGDANATEGILRNMKTGAFDGEFPQGVPALILAGFEDSIVQQADVQKARGIAPSAQLELLPGCGHMLHVECADEVSAAIARFLAAP